jgi:hypothetical protein
MLATDGIFSRVPLELPQPRDTGTFEARDSKGHNIPLGGWTEKVYDRGVFCVRPGIYFPQFPTEKQMKDVRARGLGKKALYKNCDAVMDAWNDRICDIKDLKVEVAGWWETDKLGKKKWIRMQRFVGMKTALIKTPSGRINRSKDYGEWVSHAVDVGFHPTPKRYRIGDDLRMMPWKWFGFDSAPYDEATKSPEMKLLALSEQMHEEQPDGGGYGEYEDGPQA